MIWTFIIELVFTTLHRTSPLSIKEVVKRKFSIKRKKLYRKKYHILRLRYVSSQRNELMSILNILNICPENINLKKKGCQEGSNIR